MLLNNKFDVVLFDTTNMFYRAYYSNNTLNKNNEDIGAIVGSLSIIQSLVNRYSPSKIVCVFDSKGGSKRKRKLFPNYKQNRGFPTKMNIFPGVSKEDHEKKCKENFIWQLKTLNHILSTLPVYRVLQEGFECDELLAYMSEKIFKNYRKLIVSVDKDFHQLVNDDCNIYDHGIKDIVDKKFIKEKWGTDNGKLLTIFRCIIGDSSDEIPGIHGIGLKTIDKYFSEIYENSDINSLSEFYNYLEHKSHILEENKKENKTHIEKIKLILNGNDKKSKENCKNILERNYQLMQLSDVDVSTETVLNINNVLHSNIDYDENTFRLLCNNVGVDLNYKQFEQWKSIGIKIKRNNRNAV